MKCGYQYAGRERRAEYYRLRDEGLSVIGAFALACDGDGDLSTRRTCERYYQALKRGEEIVPGRRGRPPAKAVPRGQ